MPRIKFIADYKVKAADGKGPKYTVGQVVELSADSCAHFTSRGVAVDVPGDPTPAVGDDKDAAVGPTSPPPPPTKGQQKPTGGNLGGK